MRILDLCGAWKMRRTDWDHDIDARVPGSVYADLMSAGLAPDPFYRDNERFAADYFRYDYDYFRTFTADAALLSSERVILRCEGLDTLCTIRINGVHVADTDNMHRTYEFDVRPMLRAHENEIRILLHSPLDYTSQAHRENPLWGVGDALEGFPHLRKAHCMFGWDWGPQLPDAGIWRSISLVGVSAARITDLYVVQRHANGRVTLDVRVQSEAFRDLPVVARAVLTAPDGTVQSARDSALRGETHLFIDIQNPELWWPNGLGEQPLYHIEVSLRACGEALDEKSLYIGLRRIRVIREKDEYGESFAVAVNDVPVFMMGADYIPEDILLSRRSRERTERLLRDAAEANFNCIRVWGGGFYPEDWFYDLCDRCGLLVWQDLMFACAVYDMNDDFAENIRRETEDNMRRIRHHACLALWCGNNEMEWGWVSWDFPKTPKLRTDYIKQFEVLLPDVAKEVDPGTFYWPASPSSGGSFDEPNDENRGDAHYWDVWHARKPFTEYRKVFSRFVSEFGFQSFPCLKTVESFTEKEDRNIFSYVMERHQKNGDANGRILWYLSQTFLYPKDFNSLLYVSQLLQAEAIRYGTEHWRRNRPRCMGALYWQFNDCWPVASWSGIDCFGRWKALHYFARRFFDPVLISACDEGTLTELHLSNETRRHVRGELRWALRDRFSSVLEQGSLAAEAEAMCSLRLITLDFSAQLEREDRRRSCYLEFSFVPEDGAERQGSVLFAAPKHFTFENPQITAETEENRDAFVITLNACAYAKYVELDFADCDGVFSDNYFDLHAGTPKTVRLDKARLSRPMTLEQVQSSLCIRSLYDSYR